MAKLIEAKFGVKYHPSAVRHILRALSWSYGKPEPRSHRRWIEESGD